MDYITINLEGSVKTYILFHAAFIREAWIAEVLPDGSNRIMRQFECHDLRDRQNEMAECLARLGAISQIAFSGIAPDTAAFFEKMLMTKNPIPAIGAKSASAWSRIANVISSIRTDHRIPSSAKLM